MNLHKKLLDWFLDILQGDAIELLKKTGKLLFIQVIAVLLLFVSNYLIIHFAGEQNYGSYVSLMTWIGLFGVLSVFGMEDRFTALIPKYSHTSSDPTPLKILLWSIKQVTILFPISGLLFWAALQLGVVQGIVPNMFGFIMIILMGTTIMTLLVNYLRATERIIISQILDKLVRGVMVIMFLVSLSFITHRIDVTKLLSIQFISALSVTGVCFFVILKNQKKSIPQAMPVAFNKSLRPNFYFLFISLLNLLAVRLDLLMLTASSPLNEVGYYNIAVRFADVIHYPVTVLNLMVPPLLAKMWHNAQKNEQYRVIRLTSGIGFAATCLILIVMAIFGSLILSWFGENFKESYPVILIIGASHLLSALIGPMNILFMVGGKEKYALFCLGVQVAVTAIAAYFLVPELRGYGAAISLVIGNITYMIMISFFFYKMEKVVITAFYIFGRVSKKLNPTT